MQLIDFYFDGESLSEHKAAIGGISGISEEQNIGNKRKLNTVRINDIDHIINSEYDDPEPLEFDIIADPCMDTITFTDEEVYSIHTWLNNKKGYRKFLPLYNTDDFAGVYYYGTFTSVTALKVGANVIGFHVVLQFNAPYGFEYNSFKKVLDDNHSSFNLYNTSHEIGYTLFNEFIVTCKESGNLILVNDKDDKRVVVNNVTTNEIITFDSYHETIVSSIPHDRLWNDFNYNWPRLIRLDTEETYNSFSVASEGIHNIEVQGGYESIRKIGVIL